MSSDVSLNHSLYFLLDLSRESKVFPHSLLLARILKPALCPSKPFTLPQRACYRRCFALCTFWARQRNSLWLSFPTAFMETKANMCWLAHHTLPLTRFDYLLSEILSFCSLWPIFQSQTLMGLSLQSIWATPESNRFIIYCCSLAISIIARMNSNKDLWLQSVDLPR